MPAALAGRAAGGRVAGALDNSEESPQHARSRHRGLAQPYPRAGLSSWVFTKVR